MLSDERLLRLAAAASESAAVSSRQELYPRNMPAERALKLAQGALLGARELTVDQIRQRVLGRRCGRGGILDQQDARFVHEKMTAPPSTIVAGPLSPR